MNRLINLYKIAFKNWIYMLLGVISLFLYALFSGVNVTLVKPLLDYVFTPKNSEILYKNTNDFLHALISQANIFFQTHSLSFDISTYKLLLIKYENVMKTTDSFVLLKLIVVTIIILFTLKNVTYYFNKVMFINLRGKTIKDLRNEIFYKYTYLSAAFFNKNKVGDSLVRIINDVEIVNSQLIMATVNIIRDVFTILVLVRIALLINGRLFIISLTVLPIFGIGLNLLGSKIKKYAKRIQKQFSSLFSNIEEILNNIMIVKIFAKEDYENQKFKELNSNYFKFWRKAQLYSAINMPFSEFITILVGSFIMLIGGKAVLANQNSFTFGSFMAFLLTTFSMLSPFKQITKAYTNIKKALVSLDRIYEIIEQKNEIIEVKNPVKKHSFDKNIEVNNLSFSYNGKDMVIKNINLIIKKGEKIAFVGSSGSGKTTLINILLRMFDPTKGEVLIDSVPIKNLEIKSYRKMYGVVTQESILFSDTIKNNIQYGADEDVPLEKIIEAAKIANAHEFISNLPGKYDRMLSSKATNLSGGQRQRICIARAILNNPEIIIFDEATSSLDTDSEQKVQAAIDKITENRTVLVIAHRLSTILASDKIVVMDKGEVLDIGTNDYLLKNCQRYQELYNLQFNVKKENERNI
jgi:subfamily B ATP-binding cassette protein MsbA